MALTKPILNSIGSFDAHIGYKFTFQVVGGDKVAGCRLSIFDNATGTLWYTAEQTHESYDFTLPANATYSTYTIKNKTTDPDHPDDPTYNFTGDYNAYIQTTDGLGNWSLPSNRVQFFCYVTPTFQFTVDTGTVETATNTWFLTYDISSNPSYVNENIDTLATYGFILYNSDGSQAQTSGTLFTSTRPDLNYTFSGLINGAEYKIQAFGTTTNSMALATSQDTFNVAYDLPPLEGVISATNFCNDGYIIVQVDISSIPNLENYQYARIYRKDKNVPSESWLLLIENYVTMLESGVYTYIDKYNRHGVTYQYAIALVQFDGAETSLTIAEVYSEFDGVFLLDLNTTYKIYSGAEYGGTTSVQKVGVHEPIGSQYPILVYNATTDYQRGSVTTNVLDNNYETTREINRFSVTQQIGVLDMFLKNKLAKILKDWNGNIWLCSIIGEPSISYDSNYGMGFIKCMFEWVEQGKHNKRDDLVKGGLLSTTPPVSVKFIGLSGTEINLTNSNGDTLTATIGESGEAIVTTYNVGTYSGIVSLTNTFGTQSTTISTTIVGGVLNTVTIPSYDLTINGEASVYSASSKIHLENNGSIIDCDFASEIVIPMIHVGTWSGYALAYTNQKQPISVVMSTAPNTLTVLTAATLTITSPSDISYTLSNTNGGFTNTIGGSGNGTYKLFTSGTWSGNAIATGNQSRSISVSGVTYGGTPTYTMPYTALTLSVTARLDNSVPFTLSNSGSSIAHTFNTTNGEWVKSTNTNYKATHMAYGEISGTGYWVSAMDADSAITYASGATPTTWNTQSIGANVNIKSLAYGNGYWVLLDIGNRKIWYKQGVPNGTWSSITFDSLKTGLELTDVKYANGNWVATTGQCSYSGFRGVWYRASNPAGAWTFNAIDVYPTTILGNIFYENGYWICMVPDEPQYGDTGIWYKTSTPNGTWTFKHIDPTGISYEIYPTHIAYGNGYWVVFDASIGNISYTTGALNSTWEGYSFNISGYFGYDIKYANGYWIISFDASALHNAGVFYRYGTPISATDMSDWIKLTITGASSGGLGTKLICDGSTNKYLVLSGGTYSYYHLFPASLPVAQTATYSLIKSGDWSGNAVIDNYTKSLSTTVPATPSGSTTLDIKDKGIT